MLDITPELTIQSLRLIPRVGWAASRLLAFALFRLLRPQLILRQDKYARHFAYRTDDLELRKATEIPSTITAQLHGLALHDGVGIIKMHLSVWAGEAANDVVLAFSRLPMLALSLTLAWSRGSQRPLQVPLQGAPDARRWASSKEFL